MFYISPTVFYHVRSFNVVTLAMYSRYVFFFKKHFERDIDLFFPLFMHSLVASVCPDPGWNLQPLYIRTSVYQDLCIF